MVKRRRSRTPGNERAIGFLILASLVLIVLFALVNLAVRFWPFTLFVGTAVIAFVVRRRRQRKLDAERAAQERFAAIEAERRAWRETVFEEGPFSVVVSPAPGMHPETIASFLADLPTFRDEPPSEVESLVERTIHVTSQRVADGIAQRDAVRLKRALEERGAKARIVESGASRATKRETIPERVRREVWNRDGGRCVDCGSRERLEYDHIVPLSQGGANTARNIELRCEKCNRRKGARP